MASVPAKVVLKSTTKISLNDRFSNIQKPSPVQQIRTKMAAQQQASSKNRRLAQQMGNRPIVQAALKLKKRSLQQRLGNNIKSRLTLPPNRGGRGRGGAGGRGGGNVGGRGGNQGGRRPWRGGRGRGGGGGPGRDRLNTSGSGDGSMMGSPTRGRGGFRGGRGMRRGRGAFRARGGGFGGVNSQESDRGRGRRGNRKNWRRGRPWTDQNESGDT